MKRICALLSKKYLESEVQSSDFDPVYVKTQFRDKITELRTTYTLVYEGKYNPVIDQIIADVIHEKFQINKKQVSIYHISSFYNFEEVTTFYISIN